MDGTLHTSNSSTTPPDVRALFYAWFSLNIIAGHFLVPVLVITFLFSKAKRDATLINFGIILILTSIINCLLLYTSEYLGPEPSKGLCIFQAAGFGASAPTWAVAALTLVVQIRSKVELKRAPWLFFMIIMPYIVLVAFMILILVVGFQRPDTVTRARRTLYCSLESRLISLFSIGFTFLNCLVAFGLGVSMCYQICNILRMVRQVQRSQIRLIPLAVRLLIFLGYLFLGLLTGLMSIWGRHTYPRDIYTSTFGIAFFIVFGSQRDALRVWCFWRKSETTRSATTADSGTLIFEDPMILRKKRSPPDTIEMEAHDCKMCSLWLFPHIPTRNPGRPEGVPRNPSVVAFNPPDHAAEES